MQPKTDIEKAKELLDGLISEIEQEGSFLNEHGCEFVLPDLKQIRKLLK